MAYQPIQSRVKVRKASRRRNPEPAPARELVLEEEDASQGRERYAEHGEIGDAVQPDLAPGGCWRDLGRGRAHVDGRDAIAGLKDGVAAAICRVAAGDKELEAPRLGRAEALPGADDEERGLAQLRRAGKLQLVDPDIVLAREADRPIALDQRDPLERTRPDPVCALEGVAPPRADEDEMVLGPEAGGDPSPVPRADEVPPYSRRGGQGQEELDEQAARVALCSLGRLQPLPGELLRHVAAREPVPDDRAVTRELLPAGGGEAFQLDPAVRAAEQALGPGHRARGAQDGIVDDQRGDGGTADRVDATAMVVVASFLLLLVVIVPTVVPAAELGSFRNRPAAIVGEEPLQLAPHPLREEDRLRL